MSEWIKTTNLDISSWEDKVGCSIWIGLFPKGLSDTLKYALERDNTTNSQILNKFFRRREELPIVLVRDSKKGLEELDKKLSIIDKKTSEILLRVFVMDISFF